MIPSLLVKMTSRTLEYSFAKERAISSDPSVEAFSTITTS